MNLGKWTWFLFVWGHMVRSLPQFVWLIKKEDWGCLFPEKIAVSRTVDTLSKFSVSQTSLGQDLRDESYAPEARLFPGYCIYILSLSLVYILMPPLQN